MVVEAAVDEALARRRFPTAWALRTLYDQEAGDPAFVLMTEKVFSQTADGKTFSNFVQLIKDRKRQGTKNNTGRGYFATPDPSDKEHLGETESPLETHRADTSGSQNSSMVDTTSNHMDQNAPNYAGFMSHILTLNPSMYKRSMYLVDRISKQQVATHEALSKLMVKHLSSAPECQMPMAIDVPSTNSRPTMIECQFCETRKPLIKTSDWTRHVYEHIQPFTCTWEDCLAPATFKRKADWLRHESETHRQLERWVCSEPQCHHTCYRHDNFVQHLVRKHGFCKAKVRTKPTDKKSAADNTAWEKAGECHVAAEYQPNSERCRFCGKDYVSWKLLTDHLAEHMLQISLHVLRLVTSEAKEMFPDAVVSHRCLT